MLLAETVNRYTCGFKSSSQASWGSDAVSYRVFIHTNHKQWVGAQVAAYSLKRNSAHSDEFQVEIIATQDHPFLQAREGQLYLRGGERRPWLNEDLQSFTPLRFMPPKLMGYQGRAVVIDPDIFAVGDIWELLQRDMGDKAIVCRRRPGAKGWASSVMLLDCQKLNHWDCEADFNALFEFAFDYQDWITLKREDQASIGLLEDHWNDFDRLTPDTRLLHNTKRQTQPWKTGLPVDFRPAEKFRWFPPKGWIKRLRRQVFGEYAFLGSYKPHPDPNQERFFFGLLRECLETGALSESELREAMRQQHVRGDALEVVERTPPLASA